MRHGVIKETFARKIKFLYHIRHFTVNLKTNLDYVENISKFRNFKIASKEAIE